MEIYPSKTKKLISQTRFTIKPEEVIKLKDSMKKGYGGIIYLNEDKKLTMQYHGRFKSFIIGMEINQDKIYQPKEILLRIDTKKDENHKNQHNAFSRKLSHNLTHYHWNNTIIYTIIDKIIVETNPNKKDYENILESISRNFLVIKKEIRNNISYILFKKLVKAKFEGKHITTTYSQEWYKPLHTRPL